MESAGISDSALAEVINEITAGEPSVTEVLQRVLNLATDLIAGVDGASITLIDKDLEPYTFVASNDWVRSIDCKQYEIKQGPCIEVAATSAPTSGSADLAESEAWPVFGPAAAALGVRAILAAGLSPRPSYGEPDSPPGALNLYSRSPYAFSTAQREEALLLAAIAGLGVRLVAARTDVDRLREALSSRDVIGQAKGILMERHGIGEAEAFSILRRASNDLNVKLRDVAVRIAGGSKLGVPGNGRSATGG